MSTSKTAISLDQKLLEETDKHAKKIKNSRSGVIALALTEYLERIKEQETLNSLNSVYADVDDDGFVEAGKEYFSTKILSD